MKICIPTSHRYKVETLKILTSFPKQDIYLFINNYPAELLEDAKNNYFINLPKEFENINLVTIQTSGIANARNAILNYFPLGEEIVMLDDDVSAVYEMGFSRLKKMIQPLTPEQSIKFFENAFKTCRTNHAYLWGIYPIDNPFYMSKKINNKSFIIGTCCGVINNSLRYDPEISTKEDYDFTLQNILTYKKAIRFDYMTVRAKHYTNPGGCTMERQKDPDLERRVCIKLIQKYPGIVIPNKKRENEILINL